MESEFEPVVRIEETPAARTVIVDLPGFRKEDLKVQIDQRGNIIISGERRVKEIEETTKLRGRPEKTQTEGHRFRKVVSVPQELNFDGIVAKFRDETLRMTVPLLHIPDQQNQDAVLASREPDQPVQSKVERSSPAGQEDSKKERSGVAQDDQRTRQPEALRRDDDKGKGTVAAEESKDLVEERKTEAPKLTQDFAHGERSEAIQQRPYDQSARHPEVIQPDHKAKLIAAVEELKALVEGGKTEEPKHAQGFVGETPISKDPKQERSAVAQGDQSARKPEAIRPADDKSKPISAAQESKELLGGRKAEVPKHAQDFVTGSPISKGPMKELSAAAHGDQSARHPEAIRPADDKSKATAAAQESKELLGGKKTEVPKHAQEVVTGPEISEGPMQERSAFSQGDLSARHPEAIRPDDDKSKPIAAAQESKELLGGKKAEVPKYAQDFVTGPRISEGPMKELSAVAQGDQSARVHPEAIRLDDDKSTRNAAVEELKELLGGKKEEVPKDARGFVEVGEPISKEATREQSAVAVIQPSAAEEKSKVTPEEKKEEAPKHTKDFGHGDPTTSTRIQAVSAQKKQEEEADYGEQAEQVDGDDEEDEDEEEEDEDEDEDEGDESRLLLPSDDFPHRVIQIPPSTGRSMFSKEKVLIASTVLILSVAWYLSYILRQQSSD